VCCTAERAKGGLASLPRVEVSGGRQFFAAAELFLAIFSKFGIFKSKIRESSNSPVFSSFKKFVKK
jgi:hypothetical protein